jgi:4-carboxymuconolactone decarboxylase
VSRPPRIPPVAEPDEEQAALLAKTLRGPGGEALNVFATLAHRPQLLRRFNGLGGYFFTGSGISERDRELVILRVGELAGSAYEVAQHRWIAARSGLSDAEIEAAIDPSRSHDWSPADAALLAFAGELVATGTVYDETWAAVEYPDEQRMELAMLVGFYRMLAGVLNAIGVEVEPFAR